MSHSGQMMRLIAVVLLSASSAARSQDSPQPIEPEAIALGRPIDFRQDVKPILEANCLACHSAGIQEGGLSLEDVAAIAKGGDRGPAISPGQPDESLLLTVAAHRAEPVMPPADNDVEAKNLTPRELGIIRQWITEGATQGTGASGAMISWRPLPPDYRAIHAVALDPEARFAAVGRGNQLELHDLVLGGPGSHLVDPHLSALTDESGPVYPAGAADRDLVQAVAFSPDGNLLASGGYRAVKLWRRVAAGASKPFDVTGVTIIAASGDGTKLAAASADKLRILEGADGRVIVTHALPAAISALTFSEDGATILAACADGALRRWTVDAGDPQIVKTLPAPATGIVAVGERIATSHMDGSLRIWSAAESPERELKAHSGPVGKLIALPQGRNAIISYGSDGLIKVWDITSGEEVRSFSHGGPVTGVAASTDGKVIASCGVDGAVRFWNPADGNKVAEFIGKIDSRRTARAALNEAEWRRQLVAVAEARVKESEEALKDRESIAQKAAEAKAAAENALGEARKMKEETAAAARSASGQAESAPDDGALKMKSEEASKAAATAEQRATEAEESLRSAGRSLTLAEEALASIRSRLSERQQEKASVIEAAVAAEAVAQTAKAEADRHVEARNLAFSPDSLRVTVAYADGSIQVFSAAGGPLASWRSTVGTPDELAFLSATELAQRASDGSLLRVDVADDWEHSGTLGPPKDAPLDLASSALSHRILALAFSPDGRLLATGGGEPSRSGELLLWDVATGATVHTFVDAHSDTVQAVDFSRDGRTLVSAAADKFAKAFDVATGSYLRSFEGHTDHVLGVSLKADGSSVATGSADGSVKIWDTVAGEQRKTVTGHAKQVTAVRYLGLSDRVVTASGDRSVRIYRTNDGGQVRALDGPVDYVHALAVSGDGTTVAAAGEEGIVYVWDVESGKAIRRIEAPKPGPATTASR